MHSVKFEVSGKTPRYLSIASGGSIPAFIISLKRTLFLGMPLKNSTLLTPPNESMDLTGMGLRLVPLDLGLNLFRITDGSPDRSHDSEPQVGENSKKLIDPGHNFVTLHSAWVTPKQISHHVK